MKRMGLGFRPAWKPKPKFLVSSDDVPEATMESEKLVRYFGSRMAVQPEP